jgi:hypothetical protein
MPLGRDGSRFTSYPRLGPIVPSLLRIALFYAIEASVVPTPVRCITRGPSCRRPKIVCHHLRNSVDTLNFPSTALNYLERRMLQILHWTALLARPPARGRAARATGRRIACRGPPSGRV